MRFLVLFVLFFSFASGADESTAWGKVVEVWSGYKDGMVLFRLDIPHEDPKPCGKTTFYSVNPSSADANKFLSMLLSAKATGGDVQIMLSETECYYGYPTALRMGSK